MILALTGFMGCGKSSVGRLVASRLGCAFTDLDEAVEAAQGRSVARIFAEDGEAGFRAAEVAALRNVIDSFASLGMTESASLGMTESASLGMTESASLGMTGDDTGLGMTQPRHSGLDPESVTVLALGGGTLTTPEARKLVAENTRCIYLRASVETLVRNLSCYDIYEAGSEDGRHDSGRVRPLLEGAEDEASLRSRIEALLAERSATYEEAADVIIDIDGLSGELIAERAINQ